MARVGLSGHRTAVNEYFTADGFFLNGYSVGRYRADSMWLGVP